MSLRAEHIEIIAYRVIHELERNGLIAVGDGIARGRKARQQIASQPCEIPEGGQEWEDPFRQYYREERDRYRPVR